MRKLAIHGDFIASLRTLFPSFSRRGEALDRKGGFILDAHNVVRLMLEHHFTTQTPLTTGGKVIRRNTSTTYAETLTVPYFPTVA